MPIAVPGIPFGFVLGVVIADSGLDQLAAWASSPIIAAGAAQLAAIELLAESASAAVVLVTVAFINSRHLMYSAALRPKFAGFPGWFRVVGPYINGGANDQASQVPRSKNSTAPSLAEVALYGVSREDTTAMVEECLVSSE